MAEASEITEVKEEIRILAVDDEPFILKSLQFVLTKEGYQVTTATHGLEAMEKIRKEKPRIIFLDIMMPRMNGLEVCQQIRQDPKLKHIYIIMLTSQGQETLLKKGLSIGADDYMTKPFSPTAVVERLRVILSPKK